MSKPQNIELNFENQRGVVTVEMLVLAPLLIVITTLVIYAANMGIANMKNRKENRNCVWEYAVNGCQGTPSCSVNTGAANQNHIRQSIDTDLNRLSNAFPHMRGQLDENVHGDTISADNQVTTTQSSLGFSHTHNALMTSLCDTSNPPVNNWDDVYEDTLDDHCKNSPAANPYCLP